MKKEKKIRLSPIGRKFYNETKGDKFNRIIHAKAKIDEYYNNLNDKNELVQCYRRVIITRFLDKNVFFAIQLAFVTFAIGFSYEKFFDYYQELSNELSSHIESSIIITIISFLVFLLMICILFILIIWGTTKDLIKTYKSDYQIFILPYEKKVIENKLSKCKKFEEILNCMNDTD